MLNVMYIQHNKIVDSRNLLKNSKSQRHSKHQVANEIHMIYKNTKLD